VETETSQSKTEDCGSVWVGICKWKDLGYSLVVEFNAMDFVQKWGKGRNQSSLLSFLAELMACHFTEIRKTKKAGGIAQVVECPGWDMEDRIVMFYTHYDA
jgi:hypothetical protein